MSDASNNKPIDGCDTDPVTREHLGTYERSLATGVMLSVLMAGCAHVPDAQVTQAPATEPPDDLILSEPQAPYETHYSFDFKCRRQGMRLSEMRLSEVRITGVTRIDESGANQSAVTSVWIDDKEIDAAEIKKINAGIPKNAVQERPWVECNYESIDFSLPYRNRGRHYLLFTIDDAGRKVSF